MNRWTKALTAASLLALAACAQPAPPPTGQQVIDPYANMGGGALYQGDLAGGTLGAESTPQYFDGQIGNTVLFAANQTTLTGDARAILARQAGWLKSNPNFSAVVQGHAEETGTREYNLALGARRASAVQEYLISQGVEASRVRTLSFGKERPLEVCSDEACYAKNRRAVTVVSSGGGSAVPIGNAAATAAAAPAAAPTPVAPAGTTTPGVATPAPGAGNPAGSTGGGAVPIGGPATPPTGGMGS
ncbi:peptidoglycan-associated lipoprotein Pal [Paracoccus caeni]|uniref:Peptidoglycan-associated lipoprotein n=1 Tax=Paracoccus caeni TaxID=657651 RepID=A0A934SCI3_9RHOB|nr:peptidoglycan-associated lipoprotein Pal [Paracoccus caeni]MBK4214794.1 peptidoglycan-associated lipoprotein Pal [Paracoccus caeni]